MKIRLCAIFFLLIFSISAFAATRTWTGTNNSDWNNSSNWGGITPVAGDNAYIPGGLTNYPIINNTVVINNVFINSTSNGASLIVTTGGSLTASGVLTVYSGGTFLINNGEAILHGITSSGAVSISGGTITSDDDILLKIGGTLTQTNGLIHLAINTSTTPTDNIVIESGATLTQSAGTLYAYDYAAGAGTFNQNGASALFKIFRNWKPGAGSVFNSTSGTVQFTGVSGGSDFAAGTRQFNHIIIDAGVDPDFSGTTLSTIPISGNFTNYNNTLLNSFKSTIIFNGTGNQTITSSSILGYFGSVEINKASGSIIANSDPCVAANWNNITNTTLSGASNIIRFTGTGSITGTTNFQNIIISSTATSYQLNTNNSCTSLIFEASSNATSLTHTGTVSLNVSGSVIINQPTSGTTCAWNINGGSGTVNGNVNLVGSSTSSNRVSKVTVTTGTLTILGDLVYNQFAGSNASQAVVDLSGGSAILYIKGNITFSAAGVGTINPGTASTVVYNGTGNQTVVYQSAITYNHLKIDKPTGTASLMTTTTINGDVILQQGIFSATASNYNLTVKGNWTNNGGTYSGGTSNVTLAGLTGTISGTTTFPNLIIDGLSTTDYTMNNNNSCSSLIFNTGGFNSSLTHTGTASLTVNGIVTINQPTASTRTNAWNINGGSATVSGLISFTGINTTSSRIGKIVITSGTLNAFGGLSFQSNGNNNLTKVIDMSAGAGVLNLKGALTVPANSATLTAGTAGSIFNYTDDVNAQTVNFFPAGAYHNLRTNNTSVGGAILSTDITTTNVTGNFRVLSGICSNGSFSVVLNSGKIFEVANAATYIMTVSSGMVTGTAITKTFGATSTSNYAGTAQTVSAESYGHLILSNSGVKTMPASTITVQGNFTTSGSISATAAAGMNISGNVTLGSGTSFNKSSFTFNISGNWINNGATVTIGTATLNFNGTGDQIVGGSLTNLSMYNLTINKVSGNVNLGSNLTVTNTLNFTSGKIVIGNNNLIIGNSGSITNANSSNYIIATGTGTVNQQVVAGGSKAFPLGTSAFYLPATLTFTAGSTSDIVNVRMLTTFNSQGTSGSPINAGVVNASWVISENVAGGSNATITFQWPQSLELTGFNRNMSRLAQFPGGTWDYGLTDIVASGSNPYTVSRSGFTSFSTFGVSMYNAVLPVTWLDVNGKNNVNDNIINWSTANELINTQYLIEASVNGINFTQVGSLEGSIHSSAVQQYQFLHKNINGISYYYRIKQVDVDGKTSYSKVIRVNVETINLARLYPNPVQDKTSISFQLVSASSLTVTIVNESGLFVYTNRQYFEKGNNKMNLDLGLLQAGFYVLILKDDVGNQQVFRFIKTK